MHPTTEQECLAFGLYMVAVRLSRTSEARKMADPRSGSRRNMEGDIQREGGSIQITRTVT